jgi:hypothetical protein
MLEQATILSASPRTQFEASRLYVSELLATPFLRTILIIVLLAYGPELAYPTFSTDDFHELAARSQKLYAFVYDGRYLAEIIRHVLGGVFPPTFLLITGLACLVLGGIATCFLFGVRDWRAVVIACGAEAIF